MILNSYIETLLPCIQVLHHMNLSITLTAANHYYLYSCIPSTTLQIKQQKHKSLISKSSQSSPWLCFCPSSQQLFLPVCNPFFKQLDLLFQKDPPVVQVCYDIPVSSVNLLIKPLKILTSQLLFLQKKHNYTNKNGHKLNNECRTRCLPPSRCK